MARSTDWRHNVPAWDEGRQDILNCQDGPEPGHYTRADVPVPVYARLEWAKDGVENFETWALGWTKNLVLVEVRDLRHDFLSAWLLAEHVQRRITVERRRPMRPAWRR